jgi:hypothetical protein
MSTRWNGGALPVLLLPAGAAAADEASTVAALEKLGAIIKRDDTLPGKPVVALYLGSSAVTDAGLKHVAALKSLQVLYLTRTKVTDVGCEELRKALPKCQISR